VLDAARAFGDAWGSGPRLRAKLPQEGGDAPPDAAWCAMTATRRACPASPVAGDDHWLADDV
jgi:hypothetical protein